jgi:predicted transcriptional regulator
MKTVKKHEAIALRETGHSMNEIANMLDVSKGSVSRWTRHVNMEGRPEAKNRLRNRTHTSYQRNAKNLGDAARNKRLQYQGCGIERFSSEEYSLFSLGCMLYWCEGHKSKNVIDFSNSDPDVIKVFLRFLRESMRIDNGKIKLRIQAYLNNGLTQQNVEDYWLEKSGLTRENLHKGTYDVYSRLSSRRKRNLIYGTLHIIVCDTSKLHEIYGGIAAVCGENSKFLG